MPGAEVGGEVAIVGGGLAGLMALRTLTAAGVPARLYEAPATHRRADPHPHRFPAHRLGRDGRPAGQQRPRGHDRAGRGLLAPADRQARARRRRPGGARPAIARRSPRWPTRSAPIAAQIAEDSERLDADWEAAAPELDAQSAAAYLDRHGNLIGDPAVRRLLEQTVRTEYGAEPDEASALQLIWNLPTVDGQAYEVLGTSDERYIVEGGSQRITDALADAHADRIEPVAG